MIFKGFSIDFIISNKIGGWSGLKETLAAHSGELEQQMMHTGTDVVTRTDVSTFDQEELKKKLLLGGTHEEASMEIIHRSPAWLACLSLIIAGLAYSIVNHTQSMRLLGARNERHQKNSVVFAGIILIGATFMAWASSGGVSV